MKLLLLFAGLILVAGVGVACSNTKATDVLNFVLPAGRYELAQAAYGAHERQQLAIFRPVEKTDKPPIVFIYGGAWKKGGKSDYEFVAHALTGMGHSVIIPDYRLYPEVRFPAFVEDVAAAIAYTEQQADSLLGQPLTRFILMGHSSGAHTAALLATDAAYLRGRGVQAELAALIAMSGPYDLPLDDPEVTPVFPDADPQAVKPVRQVHAGLPPVLLLHGEADERVLPQHTRRFATALQQAGVPVQTHLYPGVNHTRIIGSLAAPLRMLNSSYEDIKNFLQTIR